MSCDFMSILVYFSRPSVLGYKSSWMLYHISLLNDLWLFWGGEGRESHCVSMVRERSVHFGGDTI